MYHARNARRCAWSRAPLDKTKACNLVCSAWMPAPVVACHTALASARCLLAARCHFCSARTLACWSATNFASNAAASCWCCCVASRHRTPREFSRSAVSLSLWRTDVSPRCSLSCRSAEARVQLVQYAWIAVCAVATGWLHECAALSCERGGEGDEDRDPLHGAGFDGDTHQIEYQW